MATLHNEIIVDVPPGKAWSVLSDPNLLEKYDPAISRIESLGEKQNGLGASRKCELKPRGWYKEKVVAWKPEKELAFELFECTLPVKSLKHSYVLEDLGGRTRVSQVMEYRLKYGILGRLLDALFLRQKWDKGIKGFFQGLKKFAEQR